MKLGNIMFYTTSFQKWSQRPQISLVGMNQPNVMDQLVFTKTPTSKDG